MIVFISTHGSSLLPSAVWVITCGAIISDNRAHCAKMRADLKKDTDASKKELKPDGDVCNKVLGQFELKPKTN